MEQRAIGTLPLTRHRGQANLEFIGVLTGMLLFILYGVWLWQGWRAKLNYMAATYTATMLNVTRHTAFVMTGVADYKGEKRAREIALRYPLLQDYWYVPSLQLKDGFLSNGVSIAYIDTLLPGAASNMHFVVEIPVLPPASEEWDNLGYEGVPQLWIKLDRRFKGLGPEHGP